MGRPSRLTRVECRVDGRRSPRRSNTMSSRSCCQCRDITRTRISASTFNLSAIGTYQVSFDVSINEAGQLILTLNGADLAYTVVGRATGTSEITEDALISTSTINSVLTVRNPAGNSTALTITPLAGGTRPNSASLVIEQLG